MEPARKIDTRDYRLEQIGGGANPLIKWMRNPTWGPVHQTERRMSNKGGTTRTEFVDRRISIWKKHLKRYIYRISCLVHRLRCIFQERDERAVSSILVFSEFSFPYETRTGYCTWLDNKYDTIKILRSMEIVETSFSYSKKWVKILKRNFSTL